MKRRTFFLSLVGGAALGWTGWKFTSNRPTLQPNVYPGQIGRVAKSRPALGTRVSITAYDPDVSIAEKAIDKAFNEIELVEQLMSLYRPDSQISQLNRNGLLHNPHPYLIEVLQAATKLSRQTSGAFDPTVQPLYELYARSAESGTLPSPSEVQTTLKQVDWRRIEISSNCVRLHYPITSITLNGIAQGYASDAIIRSLKQSGIKNALIDSGEIGALGKHYHDRAWTIGIQHPRKTDHLLGMTKLNGRCLATSGDYETRFSKGYDNHHLLNPRTGTSANELSSVSIAAPTAMQADALSTAVFILGAQRGKEIIKSTPYTDALFVEKNGQITQTPNFPLIT